MLYRAGNILAIKLFFKISTIFLLFIAARLASNVVHAFEGLNPDSIIVLWRLPDDQFSYRKNVGWSIMHALFGYTHIATLGTSLGYFGYWALALGGFWLYNRRLKKKQPDAEAAAAAAKALGGEKAVADGTVGARADVENGHGPTGGMWSKMTSRLRRD